PSASSSSPAARLPPVRPATTRPPRSRRASGPPDHHRGPAAQHRPRARRLPRASVMTTTTTSQHPGTIRFLAALADRADGSELIELRYRLADGQRMGQLFEPATRLRRVAARAIALGRRTDIYVGCAPRTHRHGGRAAVARAFALWADCDGDAAVRALQAF